MMRTRLHHKADAGDRPQSEKFYRFLQKKREESYARRREKIDLKLNKKTDDKTVATVSEASWVSASGEQHLITDGGDDPTISARSIHAIEKEMCDSIGQGGGDLDPELFISNNEGFDKSTLHQKRQNAGTTVTKLTRLQAKLKAVRGESLKSPDRQIIIVDGSCRLTCDAGDKPVGSAASIDSSDDGMNDDISESSVATITVVTAMNKREAFLLNVQKTRSAKSKKTTALQTKLRTVKGESGIGGIPQIPLSRYDFITSQNRKVEDDKEVLRAKQPSDETIIPTPTTAPTPQRFECRRKSALRRQEEIKEILQMRLAKLRGVKPPDTNESRSVLVDGNGSSSASASVEQIDSVSSMTSTSFIEKHEDFFTLDGTCESNCMMRNIWNTSLLEVLGKQLFEGEMMASSDGDERQHEHPAIVTVKKRGHHVTPDRTD